MANSDVLPELAEIRTMVLDCLPEGFHLDGVDLTGDDMDGGQPPAFTVLITISEEPDVQGYGLGHEIGSRIRKKWSRDDLYIKIQYREMESAA